MMKWMMILLLSLFSNIIRADVVGEAVIPELQSTPAESTKNAAINTQAVTAWQNYFNQLSNCAPGTFVLTQINPNLAKQYGNILTAKINGANNGRCEVIMMYYSENDPRLTLKSGNPIQQYPAGQECHLAKATADALIEFDSHLLKGDELKIANGDPHSKAMMEECTPFVMINGEKIIS